MKDFGSWFNGQGKGETEEVDDVALFHCCGCGKEEYLSDAEYETGDYGWYVDPYNMTDGVYLGVCGSGPHCLP